MPVSRVENQKNSNNTTPPAPQNKRKNDEVTDDSTQKRLKLAPKPTALEFRDPSLKDGKGEPILVDTMAFNDYVLCNKIN